MKNILIILILINSFLFANYPLYTGYSSIYYGIIPNSFEYSDIRKVIIANNVKEMKKRLINGTNPSSYFQSKFPTTLLDFAITTGKVEIADLLLKYGANPNLLSIDRAYSPVHPIITIPIRDNNIKKVQELLNYGAYLNINNDYKENNLFCGGNVNKRIVEPPLFALKTKKMVKFLLENGAKINQKDLSGRTILDGYFVSKDTDLKNWLINEYKLDTTYFRCSIDITNLSPIRYKIVKVIHSANGYKEFDANDKLIYEYKIPTK